MFDFSSRFLASKIVIQHLKNLAIPVRHFSGPNDRAYHEYMQAKRVSHLLLVTRKVAQAVPCSHISS